MCGIFAYIGNKNAGDQIIEGLKRLEYRGYDSWGIAVLDKGAITISKKVGKISDIAHASELALPKSTLAIGHTRWATHGGVNQVNAHPHFSTDKSFVLAQNGIVQNYLPLKKLLLKKGYTFTSETDTEVIVRLIEEKLKKTPSFKEAVQKAFLELEGRNTIIILRNSGKEILAARSGSPLVIGLNPKTKETFFSSDTLSFAPHASKMIVIDNGQMVYYTDNTLKLYDLKTLKGIKPKIENIDIENDTVDKEGFDHFMLKEIHESPYVIEQVTKQERKKYEEFADAIKKARRVYTIASGTTGIAAAQMAYYLRNFGQIHAVSLVGADCQEYVKLFTKDDLLIAPSQSGETADVLEILEQAQEKKVKIASYVNMAGASMTRLSDYKFMAQAGPEICVMSTKVFVSQIAWGYLVAKTVQGKYSEGVKNLEVLASTITQYLSDKRSISTIKSLAQDLLKKHDIFLMGKGQNFQITREGMVKLIEGTYKHAHAIPAGDLKHYAITLMEKGVPVIVPVSNDSAQADTLNAANQVKARGAMVIGIAPLSHESFDTYIEVPDTGETSAIMNVLPLQLLSYYMTVALGNNVDKPRNIAKSVTVK